MESTFYNHCTECEWAADKNDHMTTELAERAIEHAIETGHDIESEAGDLLGDRSGDP
jgi:hypothetical protein